MGWKSTGSPQEISSQNEIIRKASRIAKIMNEFFYNKVQMINSSLAQKEWSSDSCKKVMQGKNSKLYLQFVTKNEVKQILKNLSSSKSTAIDGLNNYSIKLAAEYLVEPLHHIITLSVMQETFPDQWKLAKIVPLHKSGDKMIPKNYRPVSILSPFSKVLEKVIYIQLYNYLERNKYCIHLYMVTGATDQL